MASTWLNDKFIFDFHKKGEGKSMPSLPPGLGEGNGWHNMRSSPRPLASEWSDASLYAHYWLTKAIYGSICRGAYAPNTNAVFTALQQNEQEMQVVHVRHKKKKINNFLIEMPLETSAKVRTLMSPIYTFQKPSTKLIIELCFRGWKVLA